jgi:hypothetical protein
MRNPKHIVRTQLRNVRVFLPKIVIPDIGELVSRVRFFTLEHIRLEPSYLLLLLKMGLRSAWDSVWIQPLWHQPSLLCAMNTLRWIRQTT